MRSDLDLLSGCLGRKETERFLLDMIASLSPDSPSGEFRASVRAPATTIVSRAVRETPDPPQKQSCGSLRTVNRTQWRCIVRGPRPQLCEFPCDALLSGGIVVDVVVVGVVHL